MAKINGRNMERLFARIFKILYVVIFNSTCHNNLKCIVRYVYWAFIGTDIFIANSRKVKGMGSFAFLLVC